MAHRIIPSLWFDHTAREAVDFYLSVFPDSAELSASRYPTEGLLDFQQEFAGDVLEIQFRIGDLTFAGINAGSEFRPNPSISFLLNFDPSQDPHAEAHLDQIWQRISADGLVRMHLDSYPFSPRYGWIEDRYGVNWQLMLTNPDGEPRPFVTPELLFPHGGNHAADAIEFYTGLFPGSRRGMVARYSDYSLDAPGQTEQDALAYADFTLAGQWFAAMDSGASPDITFTEGVSLTVLCRDQAEIDRLWDALSSHPESEACGWCKDKFGVSWQIVPEKMPAPDNPDGFRKMLGMKKLVIADLA